MKRVIALIFAAMLAGVMTMPAFAASPSMGNSGAATWQITPNAKKHKKKKKKKKKHHKPMGSTTLSRG